MLPFTDAHDQDGAWYSFGRLSIASFLRCHIKCTSRPIFQIPARYSPVMPTFLAIPDSAVSLSRALYVKLVAEYLSTIASQRMSVFKDCSLTPACGFTNGPGATQSVLT